MEVAVDFLREKHAKFFKICLNILPNRYASLDTTRMTIAFFAFSGLDVVDRLEILDKNKPQLIKWIYSLQILPDLTNSNVQNCGFRGSSTIGASFDPEEARQNPCAYDTGHIAMTYTALLSLLVMGDDLSQVNRAGIAAGLKALQQPDGSFAATPEGSEFDMRFVYCACCVCHLIDDWSGLDVDRTIDFIKESLSYEGAFSQAPHLEAHGGSTYCAVASLVLLGCLEDILTTRQRNRLAHWCILRQQSGFQGRPNKPVDTCYSFWVGATLELLGMFELVNTTCNRSWLIQAQDEIMGGFAKWPGNSPDALHAYFGVCGLSLMGESGLKPINAALNITVRAAQKLEAIHARWRAESPATQGKKGLVPTTRPLNIPSMTSRAAGSQNHAVPNKDSTSLTLSSVISPSITKSHNVSHKHLATGDSALHIAKDLTADTVTRKHVHAKISLLDRKHVCYFQRCLQALPAELTVADTSRVTVVHLAVTGLDLLDAVSTMHAQHSKIINWIYSLQVAPKSQQSDQRECNCGFRGSPASKVTSNSDKTCRHDCTHIAMTYSSLCALATLRDDLARLDRRAIIASLRHLQLPSGSFSPNAESWQTDMKFTYCAVCISYMLDDWTGINNELVTKYILSCLSHEGGFGQGPGQEAHGGATYCAVAALSLMDQLESSLTPFQKERLLRWCLQQQQPGGGFLGRTNKEPDSSYCFWVPATLQLLGGLELSDQAENQKFVLSCQNKTTGGFSAQNDTAPDALHGMLSLGALSLMDTAGLAPLHTALNISLGAQRHLHKLHVNWIKEH